MSSCIRIYKRKNKKEKKKKINIYIGRETLNRKVCIDMSNPQSYVYTIKKKIF